MCWKCGCQENQWFAPNVFVLLTNLSFLHNVAAIPASSHNGICEPSRCRQRFNVAVFPRISRSTRSQPPKTAYMRGPRDEEGPQFWKDIWHRVSFEKHTDTCLNRRARTALGCKPENEGRENTSGGESPTKEFQINVVSLPRTFTAEDVPHTAIDLEVCLPCCLRCTTAAATCLRLDAMTEPEMMLGMREPLHRQVAEKFAKALKTNDLIFSETSLAHLRARGGAIVRLPLFSLAAHRC